MYMSGKGKDKANGLGTCYSGASAYKTRTAALYNLFLIIVIWQDKWHVCWDLVYLADPSAICTVHICHPPVRMELWMGMYILMQVQQQYVKPNFDNSIRRWASSNQQI